MSTQGTNRLPPIRSGYDLIINPVPEIPYRVLGLLRANGGRLSITAQYKSEKSLLAQYLSLTVVAGIDWFGFKTTQGNVLYVNLEISEEKFQERTQEFQNILLYKEHILDRFRTITVLDRNLALDLSTTILQEILNNSAFGGIKIDLLILDPRARLITGSENEEVIIKRFCDNVDFLLANNLGLSIVIVTHMGKDPTKGAIGHSRFSGWLDTEITVVKNPKMISNKELHIVGRDVERSIIPLDFNYPLHEVVAIEQTARESKVETAKKFIVTRLESAQQSEQQLRIDAKVANISDYAFHTAIRELKDENKIETLHAGGQGNRKLLKLVNKNADQPVDHTHQQ
ncbi:AAA family ATPase [Chloroflexota bacterium]